MQRELSLGEKTELMGLLFLHGMALSAVRATGTVLDAAAGSIKPMAFATSALAALLSPLFFSAMADRSVPPSIVLRWISLATAVSVWLVAGPSKRLDGWSILLLIQVQSLFCVRRREQAARSSSHDSPIPSISAQFALGTVGWMAGCWTTSLWLDAARMHSTLAVCSGCYWRCTP